MYEYNLALINMTNIFKFILLISLIAFNAVEAERSFLGDLAQENICPIVLPEPESISVDRDEAGAPFVDLNREIKDIGTTFVVNRFFTTKDTLYNFLQNTYITIDNALKSYRESHKLDDRALFLLFKGGNVLRMVANRLFELLSPDARQLLKDRYAEFFQRSDSDFSVYLDEKKLNGMDYNNTLEEVTKLVFKQLDRLRSDFAFQPEKYFDFLRLKVDFASKEMKQVLNEQLKTMESLKNPENKDWYEASFNQFQFLNNRANYLPKCSYTGEFDYKYEAMGDKVMSTRLNNTRHWIANSDNRNLTWAWGSDSRKIVKFYLVRSKIYFDYTFKKLGKLEKKAVGGELIDVSIPHRDDDRLREFLDDYDRTVSEYSIAKNNTDKFILKAYSPYSLAEDLQFIIFDSFDRPWNGGPKYFKRVNRLFLIFIIEMIANYGVGSSDMAEYIKQVKDKVLEPLKALYPLNDNASIQVAGILAEAKGLQETFSSTPLINHFMAVLADFAKSRLVVSPQESDAGELKNLIDIIENNLNNALEISTMPAAKINFEDVFKIKMENLF